MSKYLPNLEIFFYFLFYFSLLSSSLYDILQIDSSKCNTFVTSKSLEIFIYSSVFSLFAAKFPDYEYMTNGWKFLNRKIDDYDLEWENWDLFIKSCWGIYLLHIIFGEVSRSLNVKNPSPSFFLITSVFNCTYFNYKLLVFIFFFSLTYFVAAKLYNKYCVWLLGEYIIISEMF